MYSPAILAGMMLEMKIPGNCCALLKSIASGIKLLSIKPICSCIDLSISINSGPSENSTVCITDTSYSIVSVQNGELCPHFKICCASASDLLLSEIYTQVVVYTCVVRRRECQIWKLKAAACRIKGLTLSTRKTRSPGLIRLVLYAGPKGLTDVTMIGISDPPRRVKPRHPFSRSMITCASFVVTQRLFCETVNMKMSTQ